ncbi:threonine dehydrogenase-like Zn-dependent dehydrogenase [Aequitasia blattaphilus]|uniref:Alcohol dehydrogenase catalytic domain-containing protein n=1 Tax=Aequitasia blattaphilus TaxID=2949332 RepID=A0ABT1EB23_9FIRM|nr:alcohol dehydrogenase catalytic domain-containing protein [Aequitasia blattaphilus]MCP1103040.1 alcohol dehydrogenase catalytic domain-containing protein [Aequitasia blattaphilus]MCR8615680.1 alcohol dehydrogenase catalytic domain-containing protein [Aequitasia blattaphilus]
MSTRGTKPETMKALVAYNKEKYVFETAYPTPECGSDDIIIKTEACGVCASDLKCSHGAAMYWGDDIQPAWVKPPVIPGHEFFGKIVEMGENVKGYELGERIIADQIVPCGECRFCKDGHYWMCQPHNIFGFQKENNGGMAEYVKFPKTAVISRVPEEMSIEKALLIEPYGCSKHAVDRGNITNEDVVVISGAGTLGLGMVTYARMKNPRRLIVLDMVEARLNKAKEFGADLVFNPGTVDVVKEIQDLTDGYGCDVYIEATGHPSSVVQGLSMVRKLGRFVEFSVFGEPTTVDWSIIGDRKELDILGSHLSPYAYPFVIENMENGNLKTDGVVSRKFAIEEWEKAFEYASGKYGDFKVALVF